MDKDHFVELEPPSNSGVVLHRDTFKASQQRVLEWRANHPTKTPYYVLANTYRYCAPDIDKIITTLQHCIQEKKADIAKYASDRPYIAECGEYITLYEKTLTMIQEVSVERWQKEKEREQKLAEIEREFLERREKAREWDKAVLAAQINETNKVQKRTQRQKQKKQPCGLNADSYN